MVYNDGLRARQQARENGEPYVSDGELSKRLITEAKKTAGRAWLGEVSSVVLQQALADLNLAYRQAIRFTRNSRFAVLDNGRLRLSKVGDVEVRWSRSLPSEPSSVTLVKDAAGRYFASFVVATAEDEELPPVELEVGIDLGLTHFAVLSDGTKVVAPKFLRRAARKLKRLQQGLSRKARGSNNRAGWASFTAMLEYKAARYGRTFARVDRFFPSTRMCSQCGRITDKLPLNVRSWTCPCGTTHDRDANAAMNVLAAGRADNSNDRGARVRPPAMVAPRGEAVIHPDAACATRSVEGTSAL